MGAEGYVPGGRTTQWQTPVPPPAPPFVPGPPPSAAPRVPGSTPATSEATRLLCAGVYLDHVFRDRVIEELAEHEHRPVAPSLGIDAVPVLAHALRARRRDVLTALALLAVWVGFPLLSALVSASATSFDPFSGLLPLGLSGLLSVIGASLYGWVCLALWAACKVAGRRVGGWATDGTRNAVGPGRRRFGAALTFSARMFAVYYWIVAVASLFALQFGMVVLPLLVAAVTDWPRRWTARTFRTELRPEVFAARPRPPMPPSPRYQRIVEAIDREQYSPLTVYDPFRPFIGAGVLTYGPWSFVLELKRRKDGRAADGGDMTSRQILDLVKPQLERLRVSAGTSRDRLRELEVEECVFLPAGVSRERLATEYRPESVARHLAEAVEEGGEARRLFLRVRVGAWHEQVVTTVLVRVHTQGGMLVLEFVPHVLPPVRRDFRQADAIAAGRDDGFARVALRALVASPTANVEAGISALRVLRDALRAWLTNPSERYPEGPVVSVRELGSGDAMQLFQDLDVSRYVKTIQDRVVNGVREALRSRGYETGEFEQQVVNVNGNGVFIGGSMSGGAIATGAQATARHTEGTGRDQEKP
ncbi:MULTISPECIES: hypothetical protein [Streptomycetaceae]|uniref:Uncharacterized protein n=1 Tax=Streptantibioticus cattleyicolor (strain ATCC 35852 / DSM 46488 / JCM 4925 / NBRC 14057 / NRRL 8057) TaxID=1003195 RepID=F8K091_STREN|nr:MULTISPECIES: hypothetical protein [Streptomycetaceae]AEW96075.1 hypothetical protein SCATT_37040 [Streptantibioticus cattleyicolor NRRL 8057 = DSM 46488]MYS60605.1 hypothetical protein [Streptomyces sp. SID5468]CCB76411.1 conserved membrane protein of unknown function [Streptantibioticus cattleyicolor NRRL 8057 = DSM 46488]